MAKTRLDEIELAIGYHFKNQDLLQQVLVHRSYLNENRKFTLPHNERLEFLGDAVLELVVTEYLYKHYDKPEGELTNWRAALVRGEMLAKISQEIGLGDYMLLSRGEQKNVGYAKQVILANAFEALIGALYLDGGITSAKKFIEKYVVKRLPKILEEKLYHDSKSRLQELVQEKMSVIPSYRIISESGPDHNKTFEVGVYVHDKLLVSGHGRSKQAAEQEAASAALEMIAEI